MEKIELLGLAADAPGSGKDTLFAQLKETSDRELVNVKFADTLSKDIYEMFSGGCFGMDDLKFIRNDPKTKDEPFNAFKLANIGTAFADYADFCTNVMGENPDTPRSIRWHLDVYGTKYRREHLNDPDIWVRKGLEAAKAAYDAGHIPVFTDVRFPNEAAAIQRVGGKVVHIAADWAMQQVANKITGIAEGHLKNWKFDLKVNNVFSDPHNMTAQFNAKFTF